VNLNAENTAIVVDSTADFPEAPSRFPNWRVVPLYVRFGDESFRDYVELDPAAFYERLRTAGQTPSTSQPTPADFLAAYEDLPGYERILSLHIAGKLSGTIESARAAAQLLGGERVRTIDSTSASAAIAMLGLAIHRRLERGTSDDEVDELVERFRRDAGLLFTVDTFEYLVRGGRVGRARGWAGELLHIKPILTIDDGEVLPVKRVRGNRKAFLEFESSFPARGGARGDGAPDPARRDDRAGHDARPGGGRARRTGDCRLLLVRGRRRGPQRFLDWRLCRPGSPESSLPRGPGSPGRRGLKSWSRRSRPFPGSGPR
jgi:DegV family protein with EDD domain